MGLWGVGNVEAGRGVPPIPPELMYQYHNFTCSEVNSGPRLGEIYVINKDPIGLVQRDTYIRTDLFSINNGAIIGWSFLNWNEVSGGDPYFRLIEWDGGGPAGVIAETPMSTANGTLGTFDSTDLNVGFIEIQLVGGSTIPQIFITLPLFLNVEYTQPEYATGLYYPFASSTISSKVPI